jgi:hypothetical protein
MIIPYKTWTAPKLTSGQLGAVADSIDTLGIDLLVHRFIRFPSSSAFASGLTWKEIFDYWSPGLMCIAFGVVGVALAMFGESRRIDFLEGVGAIFCVVGLVGAPVFFGSVAIAASKYRRWLEELASLRRG